MTFIEACWQGPVSARVEAIETTDTDPPELQDFLRLDTI